MNHIARLSLTALAGLFLATPGRSASVTANLYTNGVGTATGTPLAVGSLVRVGTFTAASPWIVANQYDFAALNTNFVEFGTFSIGAGYGVAGHAVATVSGDTSLFAGAGGTLEGDNIYLWVFNAASAGTATQHGIFTATNGAWRFPVQTDIPNTTTFNLRDALFSGGMVVGGFGTGSSATPPNAPLFNLAPTVPEPGAGLGLLLASAGFLRRRRR